MADVTFGVTDAPTAAELAVVEEGLTAYNVAQARPYDRRPLCVFVRDDAGRTIGGATGHTTWGWLSVDSFWLPAALRKAGLGGGILRTMEMEAQARGCRHSRLYTYSFQAQGFYEKHGYAVFGVLEDFPPGHRQVWMRKDLAS